MQDDGASAGSEVAGFPAIGRCRVIGVLNVTPDSFSDGGKFADVDRAVAHGRVMMTAGADIIDVGGESTRPGAARVSAAEEQRRVLPVIQALAAAGAVVSVDTMRADVAAAAVAAGARMVNDVSGGLADPAMGAMVAAAGVPYVIMHWRGHSADMAARARYVDVVSEVVAELRARIEAVVGAGVDPDRLVCDPGLGFAKTPAHNWALLAALPALRALGHPLLIGASLKAFLGALLGEPETPRRPADREAATCAVTTLAAFAGVWAVRVHEVRPNADAVRVVAAVRSAAEDPAA